MTTEQTLREKLAASHHIVHYHGWDDLLATHLSVRIPNTEHLLISPHNVPFEKVCASNLIKCDFEGRVIGDNGQALMPQAKNIHAALYRQSDTIMSAMHTHSTYGLAVASLQCGLLFCNQQSLRFYDDVAYHEFNALALEDEGEQIVKALGDKSVMILRNHGLLTTGSSIEQAMYQLYYLETVCRLQIKTLSAGMELSSIPAAICIKTRQQFQSIQTPELEFQVLIARIEGRSSTNFRD